MKRKMILLTEGYSDPHPAKTARNLIIYKREEVAAVFDRKNAGIMASELLGAGEDVPVIGSFEDFPDADTLVIGVATAGGKIPENMMEIIFEAVRRGLNVVSGLHDFVSDNNELREIARKNGVTLTDIRKNSEKEVTTRKNINMDCFRVLTVGNDCGIGKMVVALEIANDLKRNGYDAKFAATGQTGILIENGGIPIDAVVGDFLNGSAERLVRLNQEHDIMIIEGQASITHPRYSSVSLGLLHGSMPQALIMCYEMGRDYVRGFENIKIPPLTEIIRFNEIAASFMYPAKVIGVAINSRKYSGKDADAEKERISNETGLPACDVIRHGPQVLSEAVIYHREKYREEEILLV